jgi:hypothetical protein
MEVYGEKTAGAPEKNEIKQNSGNNSSEKNK